MARLINNLPMPIGEERVRKNLPKSFSYSDGYDVKGFDYQSGILQYTKEADMESFTIKPFSNNLVNVSQLMKYSSCTHSSGGEGNFFEKYGFGFRYDFRNLSDEMVTGTQLDIDLSNTGNMLKKDHTYTLSFYVGNSSNTGSTILPNGNWAYGGNENEEGIKVYHSICQTAPGSMGWYAGEYVTFTVEEDCYHLVYNPNTELPKVNSYYTLWICGLVEGEKPSFFIPITLGQQPIISTSDSDIYSITSVGNVATRVAGGFTEERIGIDATHIIQALDNAIFKNKDIFKLDWR